MQATNNNKPQLVEQAVSDQVLTQLQETVPQNQICVDCNVVGPQWASVSHGTFICIKCAGHHRGLGVHISFVRSNTLDAWTDKQLRIMSMGGNAAFEDFMQQYQLDKSNQGDQPMKHQEKYSTEAAEFYRRKLKAQVDGLDFDELPPPFDKGREPAPALAPRPTNFSSKTPSGRPFLSSDNMGGSNEKPKEAVEDEFARAFSAIKSGWFSLTKATSSAIKKAEESQFTSKMKERAAGAKEFIVEKSSNVYQSAQDGSLGERTSETAAKAGAFFGNLSNSIMSKFDEVMGSEAPSTANRFEQNAGKKNQNEYGLEDYMQQDNGSNSMAFDSATQNQQEPNFLDMQQDVSSEATFKNGQFGIHGSIERNYWDKETN